MGRMIFDILETNIAASAAIVLLCIFAERLRRRYGAGWLKWVWILLAVRLLVPYNFSLPYAGIKLFDHVGFEQEGRIGDLLGAGQEQSGSLAADIEDSENIEGVVSESGGRSGGITADSDMAESQFDGLETGQSGRKQAGISDAQSGQYGFMAGSDASMAGIWLLDESAENGQLNASMTDGLIGQSDTVAENGLAGQTDAHFFYTGILIRIWFTGVIVSVLYFFSA